MAKQMLKPCIKFPGSEYETPLTEPSKNGVHNRNEAENRTPHEVKLHDVIGTENGSPDSEQLKIELINAEVAQEWDAERQNRETWSGRMDFILSCVGYAVGLSNVWRFPYLCYRSGGGAFLIPYFFFLIVCGMPLVILEVCLGQFASLSPTALYQKMCPILQGLGASAAIISGLVCVYYNIIITWALYYLVLSFRAVLPWTSCGNWWNTEDCVTRIGDLVDKNDTSLFGNASMLLSANGTANASLFGNSSLVMLANGTAILRKTASEEFWVRYVLRLSPGLGDLGPIQWRLFACLVAAWVFIFLCLSKGVKTSGRVVYVTATFPYFVLFTLMIRGVTLPGAFDGIYYYLVPQWHRLKEPGVWADAASQIFFSVGPGWGTLITMSSYNKFRHNCYRDALILPIVNCSTSLLAGIVVFSIIGFMAGESGREIKDVITSGPGLAFIVYPEALSQLPISPMWAILFLIMLITLGVDTQFAMFETLISACVDTWPALLRKRKVMFTGVICIVMFLLGLPMVTQGGMYVLQIMDWYSSTFTLMVITMSECIIIYWIYGCNRFIADIKLMVKTDVSRWWPICWGFITPTVIFTLLVASSVNHTPVKYNDYAFPGYGIALGWMLALCSLLPTPVLAIRNMVQAKGSLKQRWFKCLQPTPDWGPSQLSDRVAFRKSLLEVPSQQLYVSGVEKRETVGQFIENDNFVKKTDPRNQWFNRNQL